jgi:hypothetical protein
MARAAEQLCRLTLLIWSCTAPLLAQAQGSTPATSGSEARSAEAAPASERSHLVLFLMPADAGESQALRDALSAQFALIDAQLVFEPEGRENEGSLSRRLSLAQELAGKRGAIAVFWIDLPADGHWLLHMMDAEEDRVVVRGVDASGERRQAAIEAVAVMTRSSTRALIEDESLAAASPPPPTPLPPPTPAPAPAPEPQKSQPETASPEPPPDLLRMWVGYSGDRFAREVWQHGIFLGAGFLGFAPLYAGAGFTLMPAIDVVSDTVRFSVRRLPFTVRAGYRLRRGKLSLDAEAALVIDWLHRPPAERRFPTEGLDVSPNGSRDAFLLALGPHLRGELRVAPAVGLYAGGGLDILLSDFAYISSGVDAAELFSPEQIRPVAELGISFYP